MAITKIFTVHTRLDHLLTYIKDDAKTADGLLVTGINCTPDTAHEAMSTSFRLNDKPLRVEGYHIIQSFAPDECTAMTAHKIGVKLAECLFGGSFQVVVATHENTNVYHNHIAVCSTSFIDGRRYHSCKESNKRLREISDALCREHGLSVIENPKQGRYRTAAEFTAERSGSHTWKTLIKCDVDKAIERSQIPRQFVRNLENLGYEVKGGKDISVRPEGKERFVRLERNLGSGYSPERIKERILAHTRYVTPIPKSRPARMRSEKLPPVPKGSIRALYRHYLYLMGYWKRQSESSNARMHYLLREDLAKLDAYIADMRLLAREGIETSSQLDVFYHRTTRTIEELTDERQPLYKLARSASSPETAEPIRARIAEINGHLKAHRKELRQCKRIAERSGAILDKIRYLERASDLPVQKQANRGSRNERSR